jgi:hypothetical protein
LPHRQQSGQTEAEIPRAEVGFAHSEVGGSDPDDVPIGNDDKIIQAIQR